MSGQTRCTPHKYFFNFRRTPVPRFLELDRTNASHRHGPPALTLPLEERVTPRRVPIESVTRAREQFTSA